MAELPEAQNEARARARFVRVAPRKAREVINLIRGKPVSEALTILKFCPKAAAKLVAKVVNSAIANAERNQKLNRELLYISEGFVDGATILKRYQPRAMGRVTLVRRRLSHITVVVKEKGVN